MISRGRKKGRSVLPQEFHDIAVTWTAEDSAAAAKPSRSASNFRRRRVHLVLNDGDPACPWTRRSPTTTEAAKLTCATCIATAKRLGKLA